MPKRKAAPFVHVHMGGLRYYRRVPADVRTAIGRKVWLYRFDSETPWAAIQHEAKRLASQHDDMIRRARAGEVLDAALVATEEENARRWLSNDRSRLWEYLAYLSEQDSTLSPSDRVFVSAVENAGAYRPSNFPTLSAAYEQDKNANGGKRDEKPIVLAVKSFVNAVADKPVNNINRRDVKSWIASMGDSKLAPSTVLKRLGDVRSLVNRLFRDTEYDGRNPFAEHNIENGTGGDEDRLPFNHAMLATVDAYLATSHRLRPDTRNILRLMKGTGAGPAEIGGLAVADASLDSAIPYVWIRANAFRELKDRKAASKYRNRQVPLIGEALDAAKDAVMRAKARDSKNPPERVQLFESFDSTPDGRGADRISAKLNKAIRKSGVPSSPRLTAYSFRHTMKEALRSAGVVDHVQRRLLGHAGQGVADRYGSPRARLTEARDAITAALEHLGDVDDAIYSASERVTKGGKTKT